jgi:ADP-ribose pyrophosphatase YjhB (NUDIX family)
MGQFGGGTVKYNELLGPRPYSVVQAVVYSIKLHSFLVLHRKDTPELRSARNCWSFVTGLHEIGETAEQAVARELKEELDLVVDVRSMYQLGFYENLGTPSDRWHWIIQMVFVPVDGDCRMVNREPHKHDQLEWCNAELLVTDEDKQWAAWMESHPFHPTCIPWLNQNRFRIFQQIWQYINSV